MEGAALLLHSIHQQINNSTPSIKKFIDFVHCWISWLDFTLLSVSMISSIKYISPALLFNKTFLKSYQYVLSLLYLIQSVWLYVDLVTNKFSISSVCIYWFHNDLLLVNCGMFNKSSSVIMLFIIAVISTYIILYSLN